jgi:hypothetical protein
VTASLNVAKEKEKKVPSTRKLAKEDKEASAQARDSSASDSVPFICVTVLSYLKFLLLTFPNTMFYRLKKTLSN